VKNLSVSSENTMEQKVEEEHEKMALESHSKQDDSGMGDQPSSSTSVHDIPPSNLAETKPGSSETLVEQVKHAVGHVVEAITDRLESTLHLSPTIKNEGIESHHTAPGQEKATVVRQELDNNKLEIHLSEPVEDLKKKAQEATAPARPASSAKDLLGL
jgi:hypothetical protein